MSHSSISDIVSHILPRHVQGNDTESVQKLLSILLILAVPRIPMNNELLIGYIKDLGTHTSELYKLLVEHGISVKVIVLSESGGVILSLQVAGFAPVTATRQLTPKAIARLEVYDWETGEERKPVTLGDFIKEALQDRKATNSTEAAMVLAAVLRTYLDTHCPGEANALSRHEQATRFSHGFDATVAHLKWMLSEISSQRIGVDMSATKRHRWLGFVQAELINLGFITIGEFRTVTRQWLNGF